MYLEEGEESAELNRKDLATLKDYSGDIDREDLLRLVKTISGYKKASKIVVTTSSETNLEEVVEAITSQGASVVVDEGMAGIVVESSDGIEVNPEKIDRSLYVSRQNPVPTEEGPVELESLAEGEVEDYGDILGYPEVARKAWAPDEDDDKLLPSEMDVSEELKHLFSNLDYKVPDSDRGFEEARKDAKAYENLFISIKEKYGVDFSDEFYDNEHTGALFNSLSLGELEDSPEPFINKFGDALEHYLERSDDRFEAKKDLAKGLYDKVAERLNGISEQGAEEIFSSYHETAERIVEKKYSE